MKLRSAQGAICAAANVQVKNLDQLTKLENASKQDTVVHLTWIVRGCVNSVKLLSHANMVISNSRRELLKTVINSKYHGLCKPSATLDSSKLFGDNLAERLKCLGHASRIGRNFGYIRGTGRGGRYHPYRPSGYSNRGNCLGKWQVLNSHENEPNDYLKVDLNTNWHRAKQSLKTRFNADTSTQHNVSVFCRPRHASVEASGAAAEARNDSNHGNSNKPL